MIPPASNNSFLSDEASADNYDSDDDTIHSGDEELSQADVDFLDDCSLEASGSELVNHVSLSPALGADHPPPKKAAGSLRWNVRTLVSVKINYTF